jgi:hypothetical protein
MPPKSPYFLQKDNIFIVPAIHYSMELAAQVKLAFDVLKPDCVAVELPETMQAKMLHAAARLPDISLILTYNHDNQPIYFMSEPCDPSFEGLRCAAENHVDAYCIDLDVDYYPNVRELIPDPYAVHKLGLQAYYELYEMSRKNTVSNYQLAIDKERETYMAKRLKELSLSYDRVLFVGGIAHISNIFKYVDMKAFPTLYHSTRDVVEICTPTQESCREILGEWGFLSSFYEYSREKITSEWSPDRQKIILNLYKEASEHYVLNTGNSFPGYHLRNTMKFVRNYALTTNQLMPDLFQILTAAKSCVDPNYAYEVWELATDYPFRKNIDGITELDLSISDVWGASKNIKFYLKEKGRKNSVPRKRKDRSDFRFRPSLLFGICSYPREDVVIERFANFLKKKGCQIITEEAARIIPFSTSLEDGIDTRETIRHWHEKKLYVKTKGKPPSGIGSVCVIFDEDKPEENERYQEKFPWCTTWLGEHAQESDMSFYATPLAQEMVGPGISRCEYGGFMMSYPPRRMGNIWTDPDYSECRTKSEVLLMAAIDYAAKPAIVYVANTPPRSYMKSFARRFGKKIIYIPLGQLSPITLNQLRIFHVLDGRDKRDIADEYIF